MVYKIVLLVLFSMLSCVVPKRVPNEGVDFEIAIEEDMAHARFEVRMISTSSHALCLHVDQWPNGLGKVSMGLDDIYATVGGHRHPTKDTNFGYCPSSCDIRIPPGETLEGFISFAEFVPEIEPTEGVPMSLNFTVAARFCR